VPDRVRILAFLPGHHRWIALAAPLVFMAAVFQATAKPSGGVTDPQGKMIVAEIAPNLLVFSTPKGNVIASVGPDGAFLVGTPGVLSTPEISSILSRRTKAAFRYVVIAEQAPGESAGDAGWGRLGAFVAMQEKALQRIGGNKMGDPEPLPPAFVKAGVDRPRIAFSEVLSFDLNGEAIHIVRQKPGFSNADVIAHFHVGDLVYLGEVFPGDGYPRIDPDLGANLDGLVATLAGWAEGKFRVVPVYGDVTNAESVRDFHDMIVTVRDRIQAMIKDGKTEAQIVAEHPTSDFDARWGHGRVPPQEFVHAIYKQLKPR
jgi:hypothetical protein